MQNIASVGGIIVEKLLLETPSIMLLRDTQGRLGSSVFIQVSLRSCLLPYNFYDLYNLSSVVF